MPDPAGIIEGEGIGIPFISGVSGKRFARLEIESIRPARSRLGPFAITSPGYEARNPHLALSSFSCTREDWTQLLSTMESFAQIPVRGEMRLSLPGRESPYSVRFLGVEDSAALFWVGPAGKADQPHQLTLSHQEEGIVVDSPLLPFQEKEN